jgi:hypothetical protein
MRVSAKHRKSKNLKLHFMNFWAVYDDMDRKQAKMKKIELCVFSRRMKLDLISV